MSSKRPNFLWDYDLTSEEVQKILAGSNHSEKDWMITRILEHAGWEDLWQYLDLSTIKTHLNHLPLKSNLKAHWQYALKRWS